MPNKPIPTQLDDADAEELQDLAGRTEVEIDAFNSVYGDEGEAYFLRRLGYSVQP